MGGVKGKGPGMITDYRTQSPRPLPLCEERKSLTKTANIVLGKNPLNQPMIIKRSLTEEHDLERS